MAKGFKQGAGGGNPLNFRVVGGTAEPANPKENTLWVNTDHKITSWIFSPAEPTEPSEGMVWFFTDTSSAVKFNALKKNGIQVYPLSAKQYVSGAWVDVTAKSCQGGAWTEWWNGQLYIEGKEYTEVTGGWVGKRWITATGTSGGSFTKNDTSIRISCGNLANIAATTANKIDLTEFSKIEVNVTGLSSGGSGHNGIGIFTGFPGNPAANKTFASTGVNSFDVSSYTGSYYVAVYANGNGGSEVAEFDRVVLTR